MAIDQLTALDADGQKVTLYESDDPPEAADINDVQSAVDDQTAYSEVNVGPTLGTDYSSDPYDAVRLQSAASNLDIKDGTGASVSIPAGFLETGETLPIEIQEVEASTGITNTDIMLLRE